jgi:hypothetical protein
LENVCGSNEFGETRDAIHTHLLGHTASKADSLIATVMQEWALTDMQHSVVHGDTLNNVRDNDGNISSTAQAIIDATFQSALAAVQGIASHYLSACVSTYFGIPATHLIVFRKRESVRPSKHCRYDVPTERKFRLTFDDEKDENEEYH